MFCGIAHDHVPDLKSQASTRSQELGLPAQDFHDAAADDSAAEKTDSDGRRRHGTSELVDAFRVIAVQGPSRHGQRKTGGM